LISTLRHSQKFQDSFVVWIFVLLFAGQGFRNLIGLICYGTISLVTVSVAVWLFWNTWSKRRTPFLLGAFVTLAALSTIWSTYRLETFIASIILAATSLIGLLVASAYKWKKLIVLLGYGLQICVVGSLVFETIVATVFRRPVLPVFMEFVGLTDIEKNSGVLNWSENNLFAGGPIQGFMGNRNLLGFVALLLIVVSVVTLLEKLTNKWVSLSWIAVGLGTHFLTVSATISLALLAVVIIVAGAMFIRFTPEKFRRITSWSFVGLCIVLGVAALKNYDKLFGVFDRDPNLTNRTEIWKRVADLALQKPEGWGWVSYWPVWKEPFNGILTLGGVPVAHAHNAYLDVWFQLGVVGVILLAAMTLYILGSSWRLVEHAGRSSSFLPLGLFLLGGCLFIQALTESRLLLEGNWMLLTVLLVYTPSAFRKTNLKALEPIS